MILSDGEIRRAIERSEIGFTPPLDETYLSEALTTSALDLRLGAELQFYRPSEEVAPAGLADRPVIDPSVSGVVPDLISKWGRREVISDAGFDLERGEFALGATLERISLPATTGIAARVEGKSTLARLGFVVHMTAPTIHCGFTGAIVLEMLNFGPYPIRLRPGMRICQIIFERLGEPPTRAHDTQYQGQIGPAGTAS